jgi:hypothetical protein
MAVKIKFSSKIRSDGVSYFDIDFEAKPNEFYRYYIDSYERAKELNDKTNSYIAKFKPMTMYAEIRKFADKKLKYIKESAGGKWFEHKFDASSKAWVKTGGVLNH